MKLSLQTWNAILLGPFILAVQLLSDRNISTPSRALATGLLLYLAIPVIILLIVDTIKLYQYLKRRRS